MGSSSGFAELDAMIASCRAAGRLATDAAPEVARNVESSLKATAAAGTTPDGTAWASRKRDGGRAMADADKAVSARAIGTVILIKLTGPEVFHHYGSPPGKPPRQVIPVGSMPAKLGNAVRLGFVTPWRKGVKRR